jgi:hypothetical protein
MHVSPNGRAMLRRLITAPGRTVEVVSLDRGQYWKGFEDTATMAALESRGLVEIVGRPRVEDAVSDGLKVRKTTYTVRLRPDRLALALALVMHADADVA